MISVVIGLGGNLGDREANLHQAVNAICSLHGCELLNATAIYETEPWPVGSNQPWYLNMAVEVSTLETIEAFHHRCQAIEVDLGRDTNRAANSARTIDIDLLWATDEAGQAVVRNTETLTLPHPRFHTRACTLVPLLEHWADWCHPKIGQSLYQYHQALSDSSEITLVGVLPE